MKKQNPSRIDFSQLTVAEIKSAALFSHAEKLELFCLLKKSYPRITFNQLFSSYPCIKNLYVYRLRLNQTLVASRQFLIINDLSKSPSWTSEMNAVLQYQRFAIGSRAIVHPTLQGYGLGTSLVKNINKELYDNYGIEVIYGSSTNINAISLYLRHGATLWSDDVTGLPAETFYRPGRDSFDATNTMNHTSQNRLSSPIRYYYKNHAFASNPDWNTPHIPGNVNPPATQVNHNGF